MRLDNVIHPLFGITLLLFGQASPNSSLDPSGFAAIGANLGAYAILGWYLWHNTTKTIPDLVDRFSKSLDELREKFAISVDSLRDTFREEVIEQRKFFEDQLRVEREKLERIINAK